MTLIRALPALSPHTPPASAGEPLAELEALAQRELAQLQAAAIGQHAASATDPIMASVGWDLGLDAQQIG